MYSSCRSLQSIKIQQCRTRSTVAWFTSILCPEQFSGLTPLLSAVASSAVDMTQHMQIVPPLAWSARLIASAGLLQRREWTVLLRDQTLIRSSTSGANVNVGMTGRHFSQVQVDAMRVVENSSRPQLARFGRCHFGLDSPSALKRPVFCGCMNLSERPLRCLWSEAQPST